MTDYLKLYNEEILTGELNYRWVKPQRPAPLSYQPDWTRLTETNVIAYLAEQIDNAEWRVAHIRRQIRRLGLKPEGRARVKLARQMLEAFLDPAHLQPEVQNLPEEERIYYTYLLLYTELEDWQTHPVEITKLYTFTTLLEDLHHNVAQRGLVIETPGGGSLLPDGLLRMLPPLAIPFDVAAEGPPSASYRRDPQEIGMYIQQFLGMLQSQAFELTSRVQWHLPRHTYMQQYQIWPPTPESARQIIESRNYQGIIEMLPPTPEPQPEALQAWQDALNLSAFEVEFLYHLLRPSTMVRPGSPVTVDTKLIQKWLQLPPGEQIVHLYHFYQEMESWAAWWQHWRAGKIQVRWNYQHPWGISEVSRLIIRTHLTLRHVILSVLSFLPQQSWLSVAKVTDLLLRIYPQAKVLTPHISLDITTPDGKWRDVMRLALMDILRGPLFWLGLVELGPDLDKATAFRLSYVQDIQWQRIDTCQMPAHTSLKRDALTYVPETQTLVIQPPASAGLIKNVQQWAIPLGLREQALQYKLNLKQLHSVFERGETPETLAESWTSALSFEPLPEIQAWWEQGWARYGHIRLYPGQSALMVQDTFALQEVQVAVPDVQEAILGLVTPKVALLESKAVDKILQALEKQGYIPKEEH
ncbi:MAG: hypothetical protein ACLFTI_01955 [Anaerolineales bacterium]